jgi:hypothetical protein
MGFRSTLVLPAFGLILSWPSVQIASATTYLVLPDGTGDFETIQAAVDAAVDNVEIELGNGVFSGLGNTNVSIENKFITIRSQSNDPHQCIIDCDVQRGNDTRAFSVTAADNAGPLIQGITMRDGFAGLGGAIFLNGSLRLTNCIFLDNESNSGGALHMFLPDLAKDGGLGGFNVEIDACDFIGNAAVFQGGAIAHVNPATNLIITNSRFFRNVSEFGGAIYSTISAPQITGTIFAKNHATAQGGAVVFVGGATVSQCTFVLNGAPIAGSAIFYGSPDRQGSSTSGLVLSVSNSIIAFSEGGHPVSCEDTAVMNFTCCDVFGNSAGDFVGCLTGVDLEDENFSANPLFCGSAGEFSDPQVFGDRFTLSPGSPCLPSASCKLIGARGQEDCGPPPGKNDGSTSANDGVEDASWGQVKSRYR